MIMVMIMMMSIIIVIFIVRTKRNQMSHQIHTDLFHVQVGAVVYCHPRVTIIIRTISRPWRIVFHKRVMIFLAAL